MTEKESFEWQASYIEEAGITNSQWRNILGNEHFQSDVNKHLDREGGCKKYLAKGDIRKLLGNSEKNRNH